MRILFQDSWLIAVEKPPGLLSQPGLGVDQQDSLISRLQFFDPELRLVHRLDRDTSGLLLLARGAESLRRCSMLFSARRVRKLYLAVVVGRMNRNAGTISFSMARLQKNPPLYGKNPQGKDSRSQWRLRSCNAKGSMLWLWPLTGRSHQLRAHLASVGHPILGDPIYGKDVFFERMYLHATALSFRHPFTGLRLRLRSRAPFLPAQEN